MATLNPSNMSLDELMMNKDDPIVNRYFYDMDIKITKLLLSDTDTMIPDILKKYIDLDAYAIELSRKLYEMINTIILDVEERLKEKLKESKRKSKKKDIRNQLNEMIRDTTKEHITENYLEFLNEQYHDPYYEGSNSLLCQIYLNRVHEDDIDWRIDNTCRELQSYIMYLLCDDKEYRFKDIMKYDKISNNDRLRYIGADVDFWKNI